MRHFCGYIIGCLILLISGSPSWAHGINGQDGPLTTAERQDQALKVLHLLFPRAIAAAAIRVSEQDDYRYIESDGLPDHKTGSFPNRNNPHGIERQDFSFRLPLTPQKNSSPTGVGHNPFGVAINGVIFDPLTAEFWNNDRSSGWNLDAFGGGMKLGTDRNNAHVQPNGTYHYHGLPVGLIERLAESNAGPLLIGFAADGFPIYAPEPGDAASYQLKAGRRPDGPKGRYDGTYNEDWAYIAGSGTLDACNGREGPRPEYPNGTYYYVITDAFPFIPRCLMGTADQSFKRVPGAGGADHGKGKDSKGSGGKRTGAKGSGGRPDLHAAAKKLGISFEDLRRALGPPPPDFDAAARKLGISADELRNALHGN